MARPYCSWDRPTPLPLLNLRPASPWDPHLSLEQENCQSKKRVGQRSNPVLVATAPTPPVPTPSTRQGPGLCIFERPGNSAALGEL